MSDTPIEDMDRAIMALALEVPFSIHKDLVERWNAVRSLLRPGISVRSTSTDEVDTGFEPWPVVS